MADDSNIEITQWPPKALPLSHNYAGDKPVPVNVGFDPQPVHIRVADDDGPLHVSMAMLVAAEKAVPLCISLCEPICARSRYQIDISIFGNPFGSIVVQGFTQLYNCASDTKEAPVRPPA